MTKEEIIKCVKIIGFDSKKYQTIEEAFRNELINNRDENHIKSVINAYKTLKNEKDIYKIIEEYENEYQLILKCLKDIRYDKDIYGSIDEAFRAYNSKELSVDEIQIGINAFNFLITVDSDYIDQVFMENAEMFEYESKNEYIGDRNEIIVFNSNGENIAKIKDSKTGDYFNINMPPIIENLGNCFLTKKGIYNLVGKKIFGKYKSVKKITNNILEITDNNDVIIYFRVSDLKSINTEKLSEDGLENLILIFNCDVLEKSIGKKIDIDDETKDQIFNYIILGNKLGYLEDYADIVKMTNEFVTYQIDLDKYGIKKRKYISKIDGGIILTNHQCPDMYLSKYSSNSVVIYDSLFNLRENKKYNSSFFDFKSKKIIGIPHNITIVTPLIDDCFAFGTEYIKENRVDAVKLYLIVKKHDSIMIKDCRVFENVAYDHFQGDMLMMLSSSNVHFQNDMYMMLSSNVHFNVSKVGDSDYLFIFDFNSFFKNNRNIAVHIKNIFKEPELDFWSTKKLFLGNSVFKYNCTQIDSLPNELKFGSNLSNQGKNKKEIELPKRSNYVKLNLQTPTIDLNFMTYSDKNFSFENLKETNCDFIFRYNDYLINLRDQIIIDSFESRFTVVNIDKLGNIFIKYFSNKIQNYMLDCKGKYLFGPFDEVVGPSDEGIYVVTINNMKYCYLNGKLISKGAEDVRITNKYFVDKNGALIDSEDVICYGNNDMLYAVDKDGDKLIEEKMKNKEGNKVKKLKN